jgi:putative CocE/NonD family hydrolase
VTKARVHAGRVVALAVGMTVPFAGTSRAQLPLDAQFIGLLPDYMQACPANPIVDDVKYSRRSIYVPAQDGVQLAVDIFTPADAPPGAKLPTIYVPTRYWRGRQGDGLNLDQRRWIKRGYAIVNADVRGTGASFGQWYLPYAPPEAKDIGFLANWIARQPWSDGSVVTTGNSYPGTTSLMSAAYGAPAIKAIEPRFSDYETWDDLLWPGGVAVDPLIVGWGSMVRNMDLNQPRGEPPAGVRAVDGLDGQAQLAAAVAEHKINPWSFEQADHDVTFKDEPLKHFNNLTIADSGMIKLKAGIEKSGIPIMGYGSWLDSGIAQGLVNRFNNFKNPQLTIIGPWTHGGGAAVNVFDPTADLSPSQDDQLRLGACFLDHFARDPAVRTADRRIVYFTMGENKWKMTKVWPIAGAVQQRLYLDRGNALVSSAPRGQGKDLYKVDFDASAGPANRWMTQAEGPRVNYGDRAGKDRELLVYTGEPLSANMEVTGQPVITLQVTSTRTDGAFFAYLEDVDPAGKVTYVTEGELRALHRKLSSAPAPYRTTYPYRSFAKADAQPLVPGQVATLTFQLMPTSVQFKAGHRVRVAIAGADKGMFPRLPAQGDVEIGVLHGGKSPSFIDLPVVPASSR